MPDQYEIVWENGNMTLKPKKIQAVTFKSLQDNPAFSGEALQVNAGTTFSTPAFTSNFSFNTTDQNTPIFNFPMPFQPTKISQPTASPAPKVAVENTFMHDDVAGKKEQEKQESYNRIDNQQLMGIAGKASSALTQIGAATGNQNLANLGMFGGSAVNAIQQWKSGNQGDAIRTAADGTRQLFSGLHKNDSSLTQGINQGYSAIQDIVGEVNPYASALMSLGALGGDVFKWVGGGTDQQTTTDKIMDSDFFSWNIGALNGLAGSRTQQFGARKDVLAAGGNDYTGSSKNILEAADKAGKKYGLFSSGSRRSANRLIDKMRGQQNTMESITNLARDRRDMALSTQQLNSYNYMNKLNGGWDYTLAAKQGAKLARIRHIIDLQQRRIVEPLQESIAEFKQGGQIQEPEWEPSFYEPISEFKEGGTIEQEEWTPAFYESVSEFKKGGKTRNLEQLIAYAKEKNPRFIQRLSEAPRGIEFIDDEGNKGIGNVYLEWSTDDTGNAIIYPRIQEMEDKSLQFLSSNEAWERANKNNNILIMSPEEAKIFFAEDPEYQTAYKRGWPNMFKNYSEKVKSSTKELKEGGSLKEELKTQETEETLTPQKNVIPDGALHKNKHHMENTEGLTQKGIPVIDNDGEQQAEIEVNEIIFSLEVTKKLEELYKSYSHYTTSQKEKDDLAIEAGKLLVQEILFNTEDNTGLINTLKNGGKLNGNT